LSEREYLRKIISEFEELRRLFPEEPDLVTVEEVSSEIARRIKIPRPREELTRIVDKKDIPVRHSFEVIRSRTRGRLRELMLKASSKNFSLYVLLDNVVWLDKSYDEFAAISQHLENIDAYEEDGSYVVRIGEMRWLADFLAMIYVREEVTFSHIFAIYDEYV
jgi:hypothetical protein